jgi:hypothetical protein
VSGEGFKRGITIMMFRRRNGRDGGLLDKDYEREREREIKK